MQYRSGCNMFNSFGKALLFRYIYKGTLVQISEDIAFLFCKEIYMKYLILYYNEKYQPARQNMKLVTHSLSSLANKLHILAR